MGGFPCASPTSTAARIASGRSSTAVATSCLSIRVRPARHRDIGVPGRTLLDPPEDRPLVSERVADLSRSKRGETRRDKNNKSLHADRFAICEFTVHIFFSSSILH